MLILKDFFAAISGVLFEAVIVVGILYLLWRFRWKPMIERNLDNERRRHQ